VICRILRPKFLKGTPLRYRRENHLKRKYLKTLVVLLSACVWHCGPLICILSVGNSFKICIISVDLGKTLVTLFLFNRYIPILNRVAKSIVFEKFLFKWNTRPELSEVPLM